MDSTIEIDGIRIRTEHWIGGERVASPERFDDRSPIDGRLLGQVSEGLPGHCDAAIRAAGDAFPKWAALGPGKRREHLHRFADGILAWGDRLARVESEDNGSLLSRMRGHQVERSANNIRFFADAATGLVGQSIEGKVAKHRVQYDPAGVCVLITPWNSPMMLTTWKLGPALAAGNTVIVKPPEWSPLTCSMFADISAEAGIPPGVINIVQGAGATTGANLVADPRVARVSFTGSVATARTIAQSAGRNLTPTSFELGGKSAFVVLEDADLELAAATAAMQYRNAGQVCLAGTRLIVHANVADRFLARMREIAERLKVGDPRLADTEIGPIIHPRQFDKVAGFVDRARAAGATLRWGGARHEAGDLYYRPTLLDDVAQDSEIVQNEVFGPVLTIQRFRDDAEAIALANGTHYGLGGVVFGETGHATAVAGEVRTGMVWVNAFFLRDLEAPFGGIRNSGVGREGGHWSFDFFCDIKDVMLPQKPFKPVFAGQ